MESPERKIISNATIEILESQNDRYLKSMKGDDEVIGLEKPPRISPMGRLVPYEIEQQSPQRPQTHMSGTRTMYAKSTAASRNLKHRIFNMTDQTDEQTRWSRIQMFSATQEPSKREFLKTPNPGQHRVTRRRALAIMD